MTCSHARSGVPAAPAEKVCCIARPCTFRVNGQTSRRVGQVFAQRVLRHEQHLGSHDVPPRRPGRASVPPRYSARECERRKRRRANTAEHNHQVVRLSFPMLGSQKARCLDLQQGPRCGRPRMRHDIVRVDPPGRCPGRMTPPPDDLAQSRPRAAREREADDASRGPASSQRDIRRVRLSGGQRCRLAPGAMGDDHDAASPILSVVGGAVSRRIVPTGGPAWISHAAAARRSYGDQTQDVGV